MPLIDFEKEKKQKAQKKRLTITISVLLALAVIIFGGIFFALKTNLGSIRTTFNPVEQVKEPLPIVPAPCGIEHPSLTYADWSPFFFHDKLVYCDSNYQVHVKTEIDADKVVSADKFSEGLARVILKGESKEPSYIYIGLSGKVEIPQRKEFEYTGVFSEGLAACVDKETGKLGFIDKKGKFVISPQFAVSLATSGVQVQKHDQLENCIFSSGLAPVYNAKVNSHDLAPSCGYINRKGKFAIPVSFVEGYPFVDERARVCVKDQSKFGRRWGFIDTKGKVTLKPIHMQVEDYSEGLAAVLDYKGRWGYVNKAGEYEIQSSYNDAKPFSEEIAAVSLTKNDKPCWGYIRNDGSWLVEPRFDKAESFHNGEGTACNGGVSGAKITEEFIINKQGKVEKQQSKISGIKVLDLLPGHNSDKPKD